MINFLIVLIVLIAVWFVRGCIGSAIEQTDHAVANKTYGFNIGQYALMRFTNNSSDARMNSTQETLSSTLVEEGMVLTKKIVLAGGCFWGMEELIRKQAGVLNTTVGYTGGKVDNPTYKNHEGHAEAIEIEYDPEKTSYKKLLDFFFQMHNPTTLNRQGNDIGTSYRSAIFYGNEEEKKEAQQFIEIVNASKRWKAPVVTTLEPLKKFYEAEDYHQDYLQKNPGGYTCHLIYFDSYLK